MLGVFQWRQGASSISYQWPITSIEAYDLPKQSDFPTMIHLKVTKQFILFRLKYMHANYKRTTLVPIFLSLLRLISLLLLKLFYSAHENVKERWWKLSRGTLHLGWIHCDFHNWESSQFIYQWDKITKNLKPILSNIFLISLTPSFKCTGSFHGNDHNISNKNNKKKWRSKENK